MSKATFFKVSGFALILWALHLVVRDGIFAFTHGTMEYALDRTVLGLHLRQYSVLFVGFAPLGVIGFAGICAAALPRLSLVGRAGSVVALLGLSLSFTAAVMQNLIVDPDRYFHSPPVYYGWLLSLLAIFVLAVGLVVAGIDIRRSNALPRARSMVLVAGIILVPTALLHGYVVAESDRSLVWELLYGCLSVPYALCWLRLGLLQVAAGARSADPSALAV